METVPFLLFPLIAVVGWLVVIAVIASRNASKATVHAFNPADSATFVGGGRTNRWWGFNASWPMVRLTIDRDYILLGPSARLVPFPSIWMSRWDVADVRRWGIGGLSFILNNGRKPTFATFGKGRVLDALAYYGWPVDGMPPTYGPPGGGPATGYPTPPPYGPGAGWGAPPFPQGGYAPPGYPPPPPPPPPPSGWQQP